MALYLKVDEDVITPKTGDACLRFNANGDIDVVKSDGSHTAGVAASSASAAGTMSAEQFTKLASLDFDGWFTAQVAAMRAAVPQLTNFREVPIGTAPQGLTATATNDGAIEGGAYKPAADTSIIFTRSIFQTPKTGKWAVAFRGSIALPDTVSDYTDLGICNAAGSHAVTAHAEQSVSATLIQLNILGAGATNVATAVLGSATIRTFLLTFDTTTLKLFIDGVLAASTTTLTNLTDEPMFAYAYNHVAGDAKAARLCYGYIAP